MQSSTATLNAAVFHLMFIVLPFVFGTVHSIWRRNSPGFSKVECFLTYFLIITTGVQSLLVGYFEIFNPRLIVEYAGWSQSPFLTELGIAHLSFGIIGVLCYWFKQGWRSATAIVYSTYLLMVAYSHIRAVYFVHNYELGNIGPTLWSDIVVPVCILTLLVLRKLK